MELTCEKKVYQTQIITHSHSYAQLIFPLYGMIDIYTESKKYTLDEDCVLFLPSYNIHSFNSIGPNKFLIVNIPNYMLPKNKVSSINNAIELTLTEKWKAIRFLLLDECESDNNSYTISKLVYYFIPIILNNSNSKSIDYINKHFNENISLSTLANIENYSTTYYSEWFKKKMNISLAEYIQNLRIQRAKELLGNTDLSILQIAYEVGYNYESSLTRVFKLTEGITPKKYRVSFKG